MIKLSKNKIRVQRNRRVRAKVHGTAERPRLSVFRSLKSMSVQAIDDVSGKTVAAASTRTLKLKNTVEGAKQMGEAVAKLCLAKKISAAVFDRSGYRYHGKVMAVADGARAAGLKL